MDGTGLPETRSTCPYCGVGCGVLLRPDGKGGLVARGDPEHPANFGRLCSKGSALGETVGLDERLLEPEIRGVATDWDSTLDLVASRFRETISRHGPDSVAFYVSGQLLTEDYYVANKLMKGFVGSANIDTNSRLCMASSVAGHRRAFGTDTVPGTYEDLDEADLVVLVGSNLAWCHPVLYQRVMAARKARGTKIVVIDPRRTASCEGADLHLPLVPGSDVALFNHLLIRASENGAVDADYLRHVHGFDAALDAASGDDVSATGLMARDLEAFCRMWIDTERVVTIYSQGVNQSASGTDKVNAILNCHLATGRIGKPGMGPFSVTGQPNAMGGREVGGLANMLACHLDLENPTHRTAVRDFWAAPNMPERAGLKAVDMFRAVGRGEIKALWVIHTNPAVSMPDADAVRDAIAACPFTVVSDITGHTDTARMADVLLPASAWAEKSGTVTNSDRTISRQRPVLPTPGNARPDWQILAQVGQRMGWCAAFDYESPAEIFREHAALSGLAGQLGRDFDISGLSDLSDEAYDALPPTRWPVSAKREGGRFFGTGGFFHPDGRARMLAVTAKPTAAQPDVTTPFVLNTGRIRDQWHTMTRTALSPRLSAHLAEPFVDIHPQDAAALDIAPADLVRLENATGQAILRARITDAQSVGALFAPIHWTAETAPSARIDALVPGVTDPVSGQPESKAATVNATRFDATWYAYAISETAFQPSCTYWARARTPAGWRAELAGDTEVADWDVHARLMFGLPESDIQMVQDASSGAVRLALSLDSVLKAALFVAPTPVAVMRDYLAGLPGAHAPNVLAGRAPLGQADPGPTVCACFNVGLNTLQQTIAAQGLVSVEAIGEALQAGTNCGACRPELAGLLPVMKNLQAAE
ncbi:MAG: molybdopterin-dependent oxidoreductase [Pseudomonadota bacterium]